MKRNLFKLLVVFIALAAFQTNALSQANGVGYDGTKTYFLEGFNGYGTLNGTLSTWLPYVHDVYPDTALTPTGALILGSDNMFKYKTSIPEFGNFADYFNITNVKTGDGITDIAGQFYIKSKSGKVLEFEGNSKWELVQFSPASGPTFKDPAAQDPISAGGYLSVPSSSKADALERLLLVRDTTNAVSLVTYFKYVNTPSMGYKPIFVKAKQISARWARLSDFTSFPDFIKIKDLEGNDGYLTVGGISNFKVVRTDARVFNNGDTADLYNNDGTAALSTELPSGVHKYAIEMFSFVAPSEGGKVITVAKDSNVFENQASGSNSVFGGKLYLADPAVTYLNGGPGPVVKGNQTFAIWLEEDGSMTLYPQHAWTYVFGQPSASTLVINQCIEHNNHILDSTEAPLSGHIVEEYYKIGFARGEYVVGPTRYRSTTDFVDAKFNFQDATKYNFIAEKRYFYLKAVKPSPNGKTQVLDVVRQYTSDGNPNFQKKLVLTSKDSIRHDNNPYYNTPYDSLNLSAYWQFEVVYNTNYDTGLASDKKIVGYRITNELGDVLQFARNGLLLTGDTTAWDSIGSLAGKPSETDSYLDPVAGGSDFDSAKVRPDVWKVLNFTDEMSNNRIFFENLAGAAYANPTGDALESKFINGWGITIDMAKERYLDAIPFLGSALTQYLYPTLPQYCYYNAAVDANDVDRRQTYYGSTSSWPNGCSGSVNVNPVDGVWQRNVAFYSDDYYTMGSPLLPPDSTDVYYNLLANSVGLEFEIVPIEFNKDNNDLLSHDSISGYNGEQLWDRYAVDSLFNYFYEEGTYTIVEAIGHRDVLNFNPIDEVVYAGHKTTSDSADFEVVLVDSLMISRLTNQGNGKDSTADVYKWYTLKSRKTGKYMTFDVVNPALSNIRQFGFKVDEPLRQNATRFRFYQPLVDDKRKDNFIMEVVVPQHYYTNDLVPAGNGKSKYKIDIARNGGKRGFKLSNVSQDGNTYYAVIQTGSNILQVTASHTEATRWARWIDEFRSCRVDYIDNNFLGDTRMFGAPLTAERWTDNTYSGDFISIPNAADRPKNKVVEGADEVVTFTLVPAALITPDGKVTQTYSTLDDTLNSVISGDSYEFGNETRPVQLYYIRRDIRNAGGQVTNRTFLTVTDNTVYSKALLPNMTTSVAGAILDFQGGMDPSSDNALTQMFAIYGQLGLDADRKTEDGNWNRDCISPADSAFHFGVFSLLPAASHTFDFDGGASKGIVRNVNIGNASIDDEFRVTDYSYPLDGFRRQLVVEPGGSQGIPASEYVFSYVPYLGEFACPNFIDGYKKNSAFSYVSDNRTTNVFKYDFADPSQQWKVNRVQDSDPSKFDYYSYSFVPVGEYTRNQAPAKQKVLLDPQYLFLVGETTDSTAYGDVGYKRALTAIKQYMRVNGKYEFPARFDDIFQSMLIDQITNKHVGDVTKVDSKTRRYNGDSTIDYYQKFDKGDLVNFDWAIIEAVYKDRYMWSREYRIPVVGSMEAFVDSSSAKYLTLKQHYTKVIGNCDGVDLHSIPFYNIVYTNPNNGKEYYLELNQQGNAEFVWLSDADKLRLSKYDQETTWNKPGSGESTYRPGMVFCFPYKMKNNNPDNNRIEYVGEGYGENPNGINTPENNPYYYQPKVFVQSFATFDVTGVQDVYPYVVKVTANSATLAGQAIGNLYDVDYRNDLNATTWFFGDNGVADHEWVRLQGVPHVSSGWMRDAGRPETSDYFVAKTTTPENDVNYAQLSFRTDFSDIDMAKLHFVFIDSAYIGSYDPKTVWYYQIKNEDGEFLTSAGFNDTIQPVVNPNGVDHTYVNEGYAYFDDDSISNDVNYKQLFGLKKIKNENPSKPDPWNFWVVAGVDSTASNITTSDYYYLSGVNERLVFRYGGGTKRQEAEQTAMKFQYGQATKDDYTDIDNTEATDLKVYGIEGAVKVANATGTIELYTIDGRLLKSIEATNADQTIPAPKGVVIVRNAVNVVKVVVK